LLVAYLLSLISYLLSLLSARDKTLLTAKELMFYYWAMNEGSSTAKYSLISPLAPGFLPSVDCLFQPPYNPKQRVNNPHSTQNKRQSITLAHAHCLFTFLFSPRNKSLSPLSVPLPDCPGIRARQGCLIPSHSDCFAYRCGRMARNDNLGSAFGSGMAGGSVGRERRRMQYAPKQRGFGETSRVQRYCHAGVPTHRDEASQGREAQIYPAPVIGRSVAVL